MTELQWDEAKRQYVRQRKSLKEVGDHFGVAITTISRGLRKRGVSIRGRGRKKVQEESAVDTETTAPTPTNEQPTEEPKEATGFAPTFVNPIR